MAAWVAGVAASALAAAASGRPPQPASGNDVCLLVGKAEAAKVVGRPVALAEPSADDAGPYCTYGLTRDGPFVRLSRLNSGDWGSVAGGLSDAPEAAVAGLGREAFWSARDHTLLVRSRSGPILQVSFDDPAQTVRGGDLKGAAVGLARIALDRLDAGR
jgi:hypothetical protein